MKRYSLRIKFLAYTTVFGVLWGLVEMFAGTYLKMMNFPFKGALMAGVGGIILCVERVYTPVRLATITTAAFAALMKIFSFSAFKLGPVAGILIEGAIIEAVLTLFGTSAASVFLAVLLACFEGVPHFFATNWIIYGGDIFKVYMEAVRAAQKFLRLGENAWVKVVAFWLLGHLVVGIAAGLSAVYITKKLENEIQK